MPPAPSSRSGQPAGSWLVTVVLAGVLGWYAYATHRASGGHWVARQPQAYYELLTEAVLKGRTYLSLEPDPRLADLANPWAGAQGIPRAHDATYYHGRYYLYFGVAPVILLLAPWRLVTGTYLTDAAAIGVFIAAGFLVAAAFFLRSRKRFFPELRPGWTAMALLMLGVGSFIQEDIWGGQFYQVPIACAFLCAMVAAHGILIAAEAESGRGAVRGLALASLAIGCAVGARPNYVIGLAPLALAAALVWRRRGNVDRRGRGWLWLATVLPAALVGAGLAAYNYARFGDVFEFGLRHQFAAIDMHHFKLLGWENVIPGIAAYLWSPPAYRLYYPFVRMDEDTHGMLVWAPFVLWLLALPWSRSRGAASGFVALLGLVNLGTLLGYSYRLARYELDFAGLLMLAALLAASGLVVAAEQWPAARRRVLQAAVVLSGGWTMGHSVISSWPESSVWPEVRFAARCLNRIPAAVERLAGWELGPVDLTFTTPLTPAGAPEPILSTAAGRDAVILQAMGGGWYRFGFTHRGSPGIYGHPVALAPGSTHRLRVDLGGLYPPAEHPVFAGWSDDEIGVLRRRVAVACDDQVVLRAESAFYASDPLHLLFGTAPMINWLKPAFSGRILRIERPGLPDRNSLAALLGAGPVRLTVRFPKFVAMVGEPLVCTGRPGAGDMVYAFYLGPGRLRFGHDAWSYQLFETGSVPFDPAETHRIEIDYGGLHPEAAGPGRLGRFRLRFDGREIADVTRLFHPAGAAEASFGYNAIGASTSDVMFRGDQFDVDRIGRWREIPDDFGPVALQVEVPAVPRHPAEPLVVTGRNGAGDVVYLRYLPDGKARIGYDSWGVGGPSSEPFALETGRPVLVQVSLGSLFPEDTKAWHSLPEAVRLKARGTVRVRVNGRVVLDAPARPHPCPPAEVYVGRNPIGASTCDAEFSGRILEVQRVEPVAGW